MSAASNDWTPTPNGDAANGQWPPPEVKRVLWQSGNGYIFSDDGTGHAMRGDINLVAWQPMPARWESPRRSAVKRLSDEFIDGIRAGNDLNDVVKALPDFIIAITRAILAEQKQ